ncbi:MAG: hypothetical protein JO327_12305 [Nitrososphaeraceae archaeon]|nr:hypothetical protein [Nitrososphaeraceae archaeon]MBV9668896.1 hypothetical protein [Nitrososphaeraceae archaeon]
MIKQDQLKEDYIIPKLNDPRLHFAITQAIKNTHFKSMSKNSNSSKNAVYSH